MTRTTRMNTGGRAATLPKDSTTSSSSSSTTEKQTAMKSSGVSDPQLNLTDTARPKRGRKTKIPTDQSVGTTTIHSQIQETTTALPPEEVAATVSRPKKGRKPKNTSAGTETETFEQVEPNEQLAEVQVEVEVESVRIEAVRVESHMSSTEMSSTEQQQPQPVVSRTKRGQKQKNAIAQITEEDTNVSIEADESTAPRRGRKRKAVTEENTMADQVASDDPKADEEVSERNPPKRGRKHLLEELAVQTELVEASTTETRRGKKRNNNEDVADSTKQSKKSKTKKSKAPEEKRLARFRTFSTPAIRERISRAESQRIYMVSRSTTDELHQEFAILGSTGNVYTVTIAKLPNCTCPDFLKGNLCKHIIFVYLRVLRVNRESPHIYQKALLSGELRSIFANAAPDPTILANRKVREKYKTIASGEAFQSTADSVDEKRRPIEGDCPICYEPLEENDRDNIVWCQKGCGNNLHKDCFEQWKKSKHSGKVTCVYCRSEWEEALVINEGYVNLGGVQGMNTERDTSSYRSNRYTRGSWY